MATVHEVKDWIYFGIMKELSWDSYVYGETTKPLFYKIPETSVRGLADELMKKLNLTGIRVVGDQNAKVSTIFICEHVGTMPGNDSSLFKKAATADVMIPLEIVDWTLSEYVRDSAQLGMPKTILEMGHFNFEELGMKYMAESWLPDLVEHTVPVQFIQSGDSFSYLIR
jgi:putative NIF3 family GTP cyclohydrolase 1 type 2